MPDLSPKERLTCPLLWCGVSFVDNESLLRHLKNCPQLPASGYWCPRCHRAESFATTKIPEAIPRSANQSPVHKKPSRLRKIFCKYFSRKRATDPKKDPTTKPEPFLQGMHCDRGLGMTNHGLHHDPRFYSHELGTRNIFVEKDANSPVKRRAELPVQSQQPILFMQREVAGSGANGSSYAPTSSRSPDRVSGQPDPPRYDNEHFSEPENPLNSPANLDSAPRSVLPGYGSALAPSLVQNCMKLTTDSQLSSTTMNVSSQSSPLSASSSQTNTTWSGESTVTALNSVTTFSDSCSPNRVSPQHISKSSAKPSGSSPKGKHHCQSCGKIFTDRANLGRHKKRHGKRDSIPCRARCGVSFLWARTDNALRHYKNKLRQELKESDTKLGELIHLDYGISKGEVILCPAGCGKYFIRDDEAEHYTTQDHKEGQEGDTIHNLTHFDFDFPHSDVVPCRAGSDLRNGGGSWSVGTRSLGNCRPLEEFDRKMEDGRQVQAYEEVRHYNTQVEKELVVDDKELEESYTEPRTARPSIFGNISDDSEDTYGTEFSAFYLINLDLAED